MTILEPNDNSCGTADARLQRRNKMSDPPKLQEAAEGGCPPAPCSASDPYEREAAKAAIHTLQRDLERERKRYALLEMDYALLNQDIDEIREIITKGGTAAEVLKFLDTKQA